MKRIFFVIFLLCLIPLEIFAMELGSSRAPTVKNDGSIDINLVSPLRKDVDGVTSFPGKTTNQTTTQVSCGTTSASLVVSNTQRLAVNLSLLTAGTVYICRSATCTTATAYFAFATAGGTPYLDERWNGDISCITSSGSATVAVSEMVLPP